MQEAEKGFTQPPGASVEKRASERAHKLNTQSDALWSREEEEEKEG